MRLIAHEHLASPLVAVAHHGNQVGHGPTGNKQPGLFSKKLGHSELQIWEKPTTATFQYLNRPKKHGPFWAGMVKEGDSHSEGCEFNSRHWVLDGHFFTLVCCQFCIVCFKKNKNKRKRGRGWPTFKRNIANSATKTYHKCVPLQKCVILNVALFTCDRRIFTEDVVSYFCVEHRLSHLQRRQRQSVGP